MAKRKISKQKGIDVAEVRMRRFFAMLIDWYLGQMIAVIPITFYFRQGEYLQAEMFDLTQYDFGTGLALGIYGLLVGIIYYGVIPSFIFPGQTLGKKWCKVIVKKQDGTEVSPLQLCLRELVGATFLEGGIILMASQLRNLMPLFGLSFLVHPWTYLSYGLTLLSIGYAYMNQKSRCFHDLLAGTIVVKKD